MKVIGIRNIDFTDRNGKEVKGTKVFMTAPMTGENAVGEFCESVFFSDYILKRMGGLAFEIGDNIEVEYNRQGKVTGYRV